MPRQRWTEAVMVQEADGPSLSTSAVATSLTHAGAKWTMPANFLDVGSMLRISGRGRMSNIVTTPGTFTLDIRTAGGTIIFNGGAMQLSTTAHTTLPFWFQIDLTCRAIGNVTAANFMGQGEAKSQCLSLTAVADSTTTPASLLMPNTAPAVGNGFDSTASQLIDLFGTFSISNSGNLFLLHQYSIESLN